MARGPSGVDGFMPNNLPPPLPLDPNEFPDDETDFGTPTGYVDPTEYRGTTPPVEPNVHVSNDLR